MVSFDSITFEKQVCAFMLASKALYHQSTPAASFVPGEPIYEMTQIFLNCIHQFAESFKLKQTDKFTHAQTFFINNLPGKLLFENTPYPVEILFTAYAIQEPSRRSPLSLLYAPFVEIAPRYVIDLAERVTDALKNFEQVREHPERAPYLFNAFDRTWTQYLANLNRLQEEQSRKARFLYKNGGDFFKRYLKSDNMNQLSPDSESRPNEKLYLERFEKLAAIFSKKERRLALPQFLDEWQSMPAALKENATDHDPFVKAFQPELDQIKSLSMLR